METLTGHHLRACSQVQPGMAQPLRAYFHPSLLNSVSCSQPLAESEGFLGSWEGLSRKVRAFRFLGPEIILVSVHIWASGGGEGQTEERCRGKHYPIAFRVFTIFMSSSLQSVAH